MIYKQMDDNMKEEKGVFDFPILHFPSEQDSPSVLLFCLFLFFFSLASSSFESFTHSLHLLSKLLLVLPVLAFCFVSKAKVANFVC